MDWLRQSEHEREFPLLTLWSESGGEVRPTHHAAHSLLLKLESMVPFTKELHGRDTANGLLCRSPFKCHSASTQQAELLRAVKTTNNVTVRGPFRTTLRTSLHVTGQILDMNLAFFIQIYDVNQTRTAEYRRQTGGWTNPDVIHAIFHTSECTVAKRHKRMCFTVKQREQCAAEYHWPQWVPTIIAKNALDSIVFFLFSS